VTQGKLKRALPAPGYRDDGCLGNAKRVKHTRAEIRLLLGCLAQSERCAEIPGSRKSDELEPGPPDGGAAK
jgi:hypothetical protein